MQIIAISDTHGKHHDVKVSDGDILINAGDVTQVKPKFHIFGHIHEDYGRFAKGETSFINASILDDWYEMKNKPIILDL